MTSLWNDLDVDTNDVQTERNANAAPEKNPVKRLISRVANWLPGKTIWTRTIFTQVLPISPKFGTEFQNVSSKDGSKTLPVDVPDCNQRSDAVADVVGTMAAE